MVAIIISVIALAIVIFFCWHTNQTQSRTVEELRKTISEQHTAIYNLSKELSDVKAELSKVKNPSSTITEAVINEVVSRILQSKVFTDAKVLRETQQKVIDTLTADVAKGKEAIQQVKDAQQKAIASVKSEVTAEVTKAKDAFRQAQSKLSDAVMEGVLGKIKPRIKKSDKANETAEEVQEETPLEESENTKEEISDAPEVVIKEAEKPSGKPKIIGGIIHGAKELFKKDKK